MSISQWMTPRKEEVHGSARRARRRSRLLVLLLMIGCEPATAPDPATAWPSYSLVEINAAPLPLIQRASATDTAFLSGERVVLRPDSVADFRRAYRTVTVGLPDRLDTLAFSLRYRLVGDSIALTNNVVCVTISCPRVDLSGRVTPLGMQLTLSEPPQPVYRYVRLSASPLAP